MKTLLAILVTVLLGSSAGATLKSSPIPSFEATALTGESVTAAKLIGQPTILIVTPSKGAAAETRKWAQALRKHLDQKSIRIRDVLALDLPFFISESDAIGRAKEKIPARYHDQTWLFAKPKLEKALDIPTGSDEAFVLVLDSKGQIVARVKGEPTAERINEVTSAVKAIR